MKLRLLFLALAVTFCSSTLWCDEHHEHFSPNEKLGTVSFPTSCSPAAQKSFERGVALLHSFWYDEAEKQFKEVSENDPHCAMAYWGEAMSLYHQLWSRPTAADLAQGAGLMKKAKAAKPKTQREREYVEAMATFYRDPKLDYEKRADAYAAAMQTVYEHNPGDHEAAAFYALSLLASEPDEDLTLANPKKAIAILNKLYAEEPDHPGVAHYLIHACDNPQLAEQGLAAARRYASIAPSSAHALHMPSHIFARLGLWQEDIQSNLASIASSQKSAGENKVHSLHAMDFLEYAYLQVGENSKAKSLVDEVATMQKPAADSPMDREMQRYYVYTRAHFAALYYLETRQWKEAIPLEPPTDAPSTVRAITYLAHAIAAGHLRDLPSAKKAVEQYNAMVEETAKDRPYAATGMKTGADEARAWLAFAEAKNEEAIGLLRPLANKQDVLGKGEVEIPARELLADMLLEMDRPQEALMEYERSLKTDPNRFNGLYGAGRAAELAHEPEKARTFYAQLIKNCGDSTERPELAKARTELAEK